ncbi:MAG: 3'-5' exonuclease domain-containing protein 2 [Muribaculaceae bacterium]|nr:3'-5' exonuclease domain-containing protein 2 [Muribaculaceae bacterium]
MNSTEEKILPSLSISKSDLAKLPAADYKGEIHLIDSPEKIRKAVECLSRETIIGFDTETRPSFRKGQSYQVALMQLATHDKCFLIRLNKIGLPDGIKHILEDNNVLKIGVSLHDDFHNLSKIFTMTPGGFVDLQPYVKKFGIVDNSLSRIYGILFGQRISKSQRLTNWEAATLTPAQQAYASIDARSCITIYEYLQSGKFSPANSPYILPPAAEEDGTSI